MSDSRHTMPNYPQVPDPPEIAGFVWRAMRHEDAAALQRLEARCATGYGNRTASTLASCAARLAAGDNLAHHSLCAVDGNGELAAAGIISFRPVGNEMRFTLDGNVAPEFCGRGVGTYLLRWMEAAARDAHQRRMPQWHAALRIDFMDRRDAAIPLFEAHGFRLHVSEYELRRRLDAPLLEHPLPADLTFASWTQARGSACFQTYQDAFRERPGFPGWNEENWQSVFIKSDEFKPDLTVLVLNEGSPVAFAICHVTASDEGPQHSIGWIAQLGVVPEWRRRGVATAMLAEAMRRFRSAGLTTTALEVNINNPQALSVYRQCGYQEHALYTSYRKAM